MSDNITYSALFYRNQDGDIVKIPIISAMPSDDLNTINNEISILQSDIKNSYKSRINAKQEAEIRLDAANCDSCNLCMVCKGDHRKYNSWPPGNDKCFAFLMKNGAPLRNDPCKLCDIHDKELRDFKRYWAQGLTKESSLKNKLNYLLNKRQELFKKYRLNVEVIIE